MIARHRGQKNLKSYLQNIFGTAVVLASCYLCRESHRKLRLTDNPTQVQLCLCTQTRFKLQQSVCLIYTFTLWTHFCTLSSRAMLVPIHTFHTHTYTLRRNTPALCFPPFSLTVKPHGHTHRGSRDSCEEVEAR